MQPALHLASHCGDLPAVKALLEDNTSGAELSLESGPRHWLPVCYAVHMGHLAVVELLQQSGSPMPGDKLLTRAIKGGQLAMLSWLLR